MLTRRDEMKAPAPCERPGARPNTYREGFDVESVSRDTELAIPDWFTEEIDLERRQIAAFRACLPALVEAAVPLWRFGDGDGGMCRKLIDEALRERFPFQSSAPEYRKRKLSPGKRTRVMERDEYRCLHCGTHRDLAVDHIIAEVNGGSDDENNLQTLCRTCNSSKGAR